MFKGLVIILLILSCLLSNGATPPNGDRILGKWVSSEKNLVVQVYKSGDRFRGKITWYKDDPAKAMDEWTDKHNPDPALRSRKILGMDVLRDLKYDPKDDVWEDGMIYEAKTGKEYNASAYIDKQGILRVKGYWHLKIFGKTMTFRRL